MSGGDWKEVRRDGGSDPVRDPLVEKALDDVFATPDVPVVIVRSTTRNTDGARAVIIILNQNAALVMAADINDQQMANAIRTAVSGGLDGPLPPRTITHRTTVCPFCGKMNTMHESSVTPGAIPRNGDALICVGCGEIGIADDAALGFIRKPTPEDRADIDAHPDEVEATRQHIRENFHPPGGA